MRYVMIRIDIVLTSVVVESLVKRWGYSKSKYHTEERV